MKMKYVLGSLLLFIAAASVDAQVKLKFATKEEARVMIAEDDNYNNGWGRFDLDSRGGKGATRDEVIAVAQDNCLEYSDEEKAVLTECMSIILESIKAKGWSIPVPEEVVFVKTTMKEEGSAGGYTRGNRIYLGGARSTGANLLKLVAHELFHVLTRNDAEFRRKIYSVIGFKVNKKEFKFAKDILDKRISNPDVSFYDSYAELTIGGVKRPCTMMIYSDRDYDGGSFFSYLNIGLIPLNKKMKPIVEKGKTLIFPLDECTDFYDLVGRNTGYVINPEECLADNFALLIVLNATNDLKQTNPVFDGIAKVLRGE